MYKKLLLGALILIVAVFSFSSCFANTDNNMTDAMGNTMSGARNMVENTMDGARNAVENASNTIGNATSNVVNGIKDGTQNLSGDMQNMMSGNMADGSTGNYDATRTATSAENGTATFMGMNATMWTWLIIGIAAIAIIALVWYYAMQVRKD